MSSVLILFHALYRHVYEILLTIFGGRTDCKAFPSEGNLGLQPTYIIVGWNNSVFIFIFYSLL